jgi:hypothetical protein
MSAHHLFVDDLQDHTARVALLDHRLGLEDVVCPLACIDDVPVAEPQAKVERRAMDHDLAPI